MFEAVGGIVVDEFSVGMLCIVIFGPLVSATALRLQTRARDFELDLEAVEY